MLTCRAVDEAIQAYKDLGTLVRLPEDIAAYAHETLQRNLKDARYKPDNDDKKMCDVPAGPPSDSVRTHVQRLLTRLGAKGSDASSFVDEALAGTYSAKRAKTQEAMSEKSH